VLLVVQDPLDQLVPLANLVSPAVPVLLVTKEALDLWVPLDRPAPLETQAVLVSPVSKDLKDPQALLALPARRLRPSLSNTTNLPTRSSKIGPLRLLLPLAGVPRSHPSSLTKSMIKPRELVV